MKKTIPTQMKISYALTFFPAAVLLLWSIFAARYGYKFEFISSLSDHKLRYGMEGVSEVIDAFGICLICTPLMWIAAVLWIVMKLHLAARGIAYLATRSFDMPQWAQDVYSGAVVLMNVMFLFGLIRLF